MLSPSEIAAAGACAPVKNCSCLLAVVLRLLGKQASLAFRVRCLVSIPHPHPMWKLLPSHLREEETKVVSSKGSYNNKL